MDRKDSMWFRIYNFLLMRIRLGCYKPGDQILIKPICDLFDVSNSTVRRALVLLEEEQYVSPSENRGAAVIWDSSKAAPLSDDLFITKDTMIDTHKSYAILQPGILWQGLRLSNQQELEQIITLPVHTVSSEPIVYLIKRIIKQLRNPLMLDLDRNITLFTDPTTLRYYLEYNDINHSNLQKMYNGFLRVIEQCKNQEYEHIASRIDELYELYGQMPVYAKEEIIHPPMRAFHWRNSSVGAAISGHLVAKISTSVYPARTYLPSVETLAKQYSVSRMTIRRTIWLLNSMGITETINGAGTRVLAFRGDAERIKWDDQDLQKNLLQFLYTLQFLLVTCKRITEVTFCNVSKETMKRMAEEIEESIMDGLYFVAFGIWIKCIIQFTDLAGIREIYGYLLSQLVWGLPLRFADGFHRFTEQVQKLLNALKLGDKQMFTHELVHYCNSTFLDCREILVKLEVKGAADVPIPIIDD